MSISIRLISFHCSAVFQDYSLHQPRAGKGGHRSQEDALEDPTQVPSVPRLTWAFFCSSVFRVLGFVYTSGLSLRLDHLTLDAARLTNPMRASNYLEEDLVGRVKRQLRPIIDFFLSLL